VVYRPTNLALVGRACGLSGVERRRRAPKELQRLLGARARLGAVGEERQPLVCGELQPVEAQAELADDGMVEVLDG